MVNSGIVIRQINWSYVLDSGGYKELDFWYGVDPDRNIGFTINSVSNRRRIPALILGTLMGGSTKSGKISYSPWPCETFMRPYKWSSGITTNCGKYSKENQKRIIEHLMQIYQ